MTDIALVALIVISSIVLFLFARRQGLKSSVRDAQSVLMMQQYVESLRNDLRDSLHKITENVNLQLAHVTQQIQSQTHNVGDRLDTAARVIGDVQKNLGELGKATQEIKELGQSVSKLDELLRAPKLRGGLGEFLLEDLLRQVLPADHITMQHRFRNGFVVDAIIRTSDRIVPIDSKFPLENFRKMIAGNDDADRRSYQKAFTNDVKKHIDAIAEKYILPDEGTFPFALMYIPAENIYYEVIIKDEYADGDSMYSYALQRKVVPVSPNSFYAYLQVIALGLRGLRIEDSARDIQNTLARLQGDVVHLREVFDTMGIHLDNARKKYDDADKRLSNFEGKLERIADDRLASDQPSAAALEEAKLFV
ncbi:MAG: DNA recombination protein RmuC [Ignavibacteriae bacterium]|nr:DNA recombination protein RmuC [Ignavibacteria bacterium]MBI3363899.1 DNA recombination protein RmuC [Ignavibacteriota bacterium]